ncbi:hypothetical protein BC827DRAFT_1159033 [Russula dissimulans]|nr:hypothetical protein BC827DRAFT_1159033 [Russula dissimulans]
MFFHTSSYSYPSKTPVRRRKNLINHGFSHPLENPKACPAGRPATISSPASEFKDGLENRTFWKRIKQARNLSENADDVLREIRGMLLPGPPTQTGPTRRPINFS